MTEEITFRDYLIQHEIPNTVDGIKVETVCSSDYTQMQQLTKQHGGTKGIVGGIRHGLCNLSRRHGKALILKELSTWKLGVRDGHTEIYDEKGRLIEDAYYKQGIKHGRCRLFIDGKVIEDCEYVDGNPCVQDLQTMCLNKLNTTTSLV